MYVIVWEFLIKERSIVQFMEAYNSTGLWAEFFKKGCGYLRTELHRDTTRPNRFITIDYWDSEEQYRLFQSAHQDEYKALDKKCEQFTEHESHIGSFISEST